MMNQIGGVTPTRARPRLCHWLALSLLGTSFLMVMLDQTIIYVALPSIQNELELTTPTLQWVMTAFLLSFGALLMVSGRMAGVLGPRRMFTLGLSLFTVASLLCGLAQSAAMLLIARGVQGAGAALIAPTALPLLAMTFGDGPPRRRALRLWTVIGALGGTVGLLVGGPITDGPGWRWIFLATVPIGLAMTALALIVLPGNGVSTSGRRLDLPAAITLAGALVLFVYAINNTTGVSWSSIETIGPLAAATVLLAVFAHLESRSSDPLVPLGMLDSPARLGGIMVLLASGMAVDSLLFLLTLYGQEVLGLSATGFGVMMTVLTLSSVVGSFVAQALIVRCGLRLIAAVGMVLTGLGLFLLTFPGAGLTAADFPLAVFLFGAGLGTSFVSGQIAVNFEANEAEAPAAVALTDASFSVGSVIGLAIVSRALTSPDHLLKASARLSPAAITAGVHVAFIVAIGFTVLGLMAALVLLARPTPSTGGS
jgi:MFS family permease